MWTRLRDCRDNVLRLQPSRIWYHIYGAAINMGTVACVRAPCRLRFVIRNRRCAKWWVGLEVPFDRLIEETLHAAMGLLVEERERREVTGGWHDVHRSIGPRLPFWVASIS